MNNLIPPASLTERRAFWLRTSRACFLITLVCLGLMLTHKSTPADFFGRYSARYIPLLGLLLMIALGSLALYLVAYTDRLPALSVNVPKTRWFGWATIGVGTLLLFCVWMFVQPTSSDIPGIAVFRVYLSGSVIAGMIFLLYSSQTFHSLVAKRWPLYIGLITLLSVVVSALQLLPNARFTEYYDEALLLNWGWSVYQTGHVGLLPSLPPAHIVLGQTPLLLSGLWMSITGIGVPQARLFYLLIAWGAAPFIYLTTRTLYGRFAALLSGLIAAFIPLTHIYIRTDSVVAATLSIALYFYFLGRASQKAWQHYLVGLALGFSLEGHYYGVRYIAGFTLIYAVDYAAMLLREKRWHWNTAFWAFALGMLSYGAFFIVVHVLPVPGGTLGYATGQYSIETDIRHYDDPFVRLISENFNFYRNYLGAYSIEAALVIGGIFAALLRRTSADLRLLTLIVISRLVLFVLLAHQNAVYWLHEMPFIATLGAAFLAQLSKQLNLNDSVPKQVVRMNLATLGITIAMFTAFAANVLLTAVYKSQIDPVIETSRQIDRLLPADMQVIAPEPYYLGMPNRRSFLSQTVLFQDNPEIWLKHPSQAFIFTTGLLSSEQPQVIRYIQTKQLAKAYCFPHGYLDYPVIVYMPKDRLPPSVPQNCAEGLSAAVHWKG